MKENLELIDTINTDVNQYNVDAINIDYEWKEI